MRIVSLKSLHDSMVGGAWPLLVGGAICLVNSVNERDHYLLSFGCSAYFFFVAPSVFYDMLAPHNGGCRGG